MKNTDEQIIKEILGNNNILASKITRFTSGQINRAYDIDGKFVVKIEGDLEFAKDILHHQPEMIEKLSASGAKVPQLIDHGSINGKNYLLMKKVEGSGLSDVWYKLDLKQKENFISQIAEQLKIFHSIRFDDFTISGQSGKKYGKWIDAVKDVSDFGQINKDALDKQAKEDLEYVESFFKDKINILEKVDESVLVHQDIHFENVFYKGDEITGIIDFDWSCQAPREYDLWIIADYFHAPWYYVEKDLEKHYKNQMADEIKMLRKYYPELFEIEDLLDKVRLYYVSSLIDLYEDCQKGMWSKDVLKKAHIKIRDFYRTDWLEKFLLG